MLSVLSHVKKQFSSSARALRSTRTLTTAGILLAIQMVLSSYGTIEVTDSLKISLAHLALAPTAVFFGPVVAGMQGALSDILGFMLKPSGPYFPGFTISAMLLGVFYGVALYKTERKLWQIIAVRVAVMLIINIGLNTVFLTMLYGPSRLATLPVRAMKNLIQLPVDCFLLYTMCRVLHRVPDPLAAR